MDIVLENILRLMKEKNVSSKVLCEQLKLNPQQITNWKNGNTKSYLKYTEQIAQILDVEITELYGIKVYTGDIKITQEEKEYIMLCRTFSVEQQERVKDFITSISLEV